MIKDCLRIFQNELQKYTDKMVIDNYIPKDGTYLLITMHGDDFLPSEPVDILYNKKEDRVENRTHTDYDYLRQLDYYSKLVEMNKPVDPKKVIHSNNYLTFFVKKESIKEQKVTKERDIMKYYCIRKLNMKRKRILGNCIEPLKKN